MIKLMSRKCALGDIRRIRGGGVKSLIGFITSGLAPFAIKAVAAVAKLIANLI